MNHPKPQASPCPLPMAQRISVLSAWPVPLASQRGGMLIGVVVGLLVGLVLAVVVAFMVMKSPGPFVEKVKRPGEVTTEAGALPDPNKGLTKGKAEAGVAEAPAPAAGTEDSAEAKGAPPTAGVTVGSGPTESALPASTPGAGAPVSAAPVVTATPLPVLPSAPASTPAGGAASPTPGTGSAPPSTSPEPTPERASSYLLQIGAYRSQEDAESTKGRLALVGLEAAIVRAEVNGTTFWRVRVGPFKDLDDTNRARTRLAENGFDSSIIRSR